jgi:hypothetical protein
MKVQKFDRIVAWTSVPMAIIGSVLPLLGLEGTWGTVALVACPVLVLTAIGLTTYARGRVIQEIL